jgi:hypothetical protein
MSYSDDYERDDDQTGRRSRFGHEDDFDEQFVRRSSRYDDDGDSPKHSRFGIAAFIMSLGVGAFVFLVFVIAGILSVRAGGELDEKSPEAIFVGLGILAGFALNLISLCLAIAGLCEKRRNKIFAILALVISLIIFVGVCGTFAVGMAMG